MPTTFDIPAHHAFVQKHGDQIRWYRGLFCPCGATPDANRARTTCIHCFGTGIRYEAPVILTGIVTQVTRDKALMESGFADPGDLKLGLSPLETNILSEWDMIELQWDKGQPFMGDLISRGTGSLIDVLSYPAKEIFSCTRIDATTQAIIAYASGVNFTISGRTLTWIVGQPQPAAGQVYSIKYTAIFQWIVFRSPFDRYENGTSLGQRTLLRKRALVFKA